ncbi:hypothetical protein HYZ82_00500 [Candidatus Nomurabacteria bacterium]|nr:hypothetical protein [Candidatus Nomurabacteria bacterium]
MEQEKFPNAPVYNHEKVEKFRTVFEKIVKNVMALDDQDLTKTIELQKELVKKVTDLENKYSNAVRYGMFHILGGSTIPSDLPALYDDFPNGDSVEKFLEDLLKRY